MTSWKTTVCGWFAGLGFVLSQINDPPWLHHLGMYLCGLFMAAHGTVARDNNVSSEAAGVKTLPTNEKFTSRF